MGLSSFLWKQKRCGFRVEGRPISVNAQLNTSKPIMPTPTGWESGKKYVAVSESKTLLEAMGTNGYVVPGIPEIFVVSTKSPFFPIFKKAHMD